MAGIVTDDFVPPGASAGMVDKDGKGCILVGMKRVRAVIAVLLMANCAIRAVAQYPTYSYPAPSPTPSGQLLADQQLDQMLGPIALYPDPLIAQILPAATQPSQIALAANYLAQGGDPNQVDAQPWDSSVKALVWYPEVLQFMDSNLSWTAQLGQAFLGQPTDVMNSIQRLRAQAQALGNLQSSPQQTVVNDSGVIDIEPASPDVIYVPVYDPGVIFYQRPYYGRAFVTFGTGFRIGRWLNHDLDWRDHNVVVWGRDHPRPDDWWRRPPAKRRPEVVAGRPTAWRPPERRATIAPVYRVDRGYESRPVRTEPARPAPETRAPKPEPPPRTTVQPHPMPARPAASAFNGTQSAQQTRAASSRGEQSHQAASGHGGTSHGVGNEGNKH